jgi:signal transduction histidine kinase
MANESEPHGDRRKRGDRRSSKDRRGGEERRRGLDRRAAQDRRCGFDRRSGGDRRAQGPVGVDQRFQGALRTAEAISHLFSQPLTVITGYVDLLAAETRQGEAQKKLNIIRGQLGVLATYLRNLREIEEFRTVEFAGLTLLDITSARTEDNSRGVK